MTVLMWLSPLGGLALFPTGMGHQGGKALESSAFAGQLQKILSKLD